MATVTPPLEWNFSQVFGERSAKEQVQDVDIISTMDFEKTGDYLATGACGGRVVIFENTDVSISGRHSRKELEHLDYSIKKRPEYRYKTEFQSHEPEFDYLKSVEIEEKINKVRRCSLLNGSKRLWVKQLKLMNFLIKNEKGLPASILIIHPGVTNCHPDSWMMMMSQIIMRVDQQCGDSLKRISKKKLMPRSVLSMQRGLNSIEKSLGNHPMHPLDHLDVTSTRKARERSPNTRLTGKKSRGLRHVKELKSPSVKMKNLRSMLGQQMMDLTRRRRLGIEAVGVSVMRLSRTWNLLLRRMYLIGEWCFMIATMNEKLLWVIEKMKTESRVV